MTLSFIYLLIASVLQLGWLYNMKRLKKGIWKELKTKPFHLYKKLLIVLPVILYLVFGISNVIFLTWSMQNIPPSIAYAVWTGLVIVAATIIDQIYSRKRMNSGKWIFIVIILIGIIGLRLSAL